MAKSLRSWFLLCLIVTGTTLILLGLSVPHIAAHPVTSDPAGDSFSGITLSDQSHQAILGFLQSHCADCHDSTAEGGLELEVLDWRPDDFEGFKKLVGLFDRVTSGEMPPETEPRPETDALHKFLSHLNTYLTRLEKERYRVHGRSILRRMNRYEYENSLRDLLSLPWIQIREMLPEDGERHRFNKISQALDVSHVQLSRYMVAADDAMKKAMSVQFERAERTLRRFYARDEMSLVGNFWPRENSTLPDRHSFPVLDSQAQPDVRRGDAPRSSPETREREAVGKVSSIFSDAGGYSWSQFRVPASGRYRLRFKGYSIWVSGGGIGRWFYEGFGDEKAPVFHLPLWHRPNADEIWPGRRPEPIGVYAQSSGNSRPIGKFDFGVEPTECEIEVDLVINEVVQTDGMRLFRTRVNGTDEQYVNPLATESGMPGYAIQWMEVEGPLDEESTLEGYRLLFGELPMRRVEDVDSILGVVIQVAAPAPPPIPASAPSISRRQGPPTALQGTGPSPGTGPLQGTPGPGQGQQGPRRGFGAPRVVNVRVEVEVGDPFVESARLLDRFLKRTYRQSLDERLRGRLLTLFRDQYEQGVGFASSMLTVYTAVLASPMFIFIDEQPGKLDGMARATRLSLFLWNSLPDDELRQSALRGDLDNPDELRRQAERLLNDAKSIRFVEAFTDYWLDLRKVDDTSPSTTLYNDYELDDPLKLAAIEETHLFVAKLLADNLPASNIVDSNFTFLNERLAEHYGIDGVEGANLRYVELPAESVRGGVMTQASVLKVTANGTTTSPVVRGSWITERILGTEIPPPPSVPAVEPDIRGAVTIRQQLELHRAESSCAACHSKIDPPGFALEAFDVMGGFRTHYRAFNEDAIPVDGYGLNGQSFVYHYALPVVATGNLPSGESFHDVRQFKRLLLNDERRLARNLANQLTIFATGAPISFTDREAIEAILDATKVNQFGVRSLIHEIVQSELFLYK